MYAKVIVDVPAKQTNRAYDYIVPETLRAWIEIGSRVAVRFGPRKIQGFVVSIQAESDVDASKLRAIEDVLDVHPPLNEELVALASWMSERYICHRIVALQAMIPRALKARYERYITIGNSASEVCADRAHKQTGEHADIVAFVQAKQKVELSALLSEFPTRGTAIKALIAKGTLLEIQTIKDQVSKKKERVVFPPERHLLEEFLALVPANAHRQKQVLDYFITHPSPIRLTELISHLEVTASTVKNMADKGWLELKESEVFRDPYADRQFTQTTQLSLTIEQQHVYDRIVAPLEARQHAAFLLHGITGSGKTEVYLQAIEQCLNDGREAIVLVPEIALTPQMVERFKGRFGNLVAVLHSRLSQGERYDEWRKIQRKHVKVVIGARSAVFAPFTKLGLIIVDEEHESSYKQEESPKYHARDIALQRGKSHEAVVMFGSATPSLESYHHPEIEVLSMPSRVENRPLPEVNIVDMRNELRQGNRSMFSRALHTAIAERLEKREQMVLMLNRRGFSTFIMCRSCGYVCQCPHCDIALTYHSQSRNVRCHYCGYAEREVAQCPECKSEHIRYFGTGTQRVEEELQKLFPTIRIVRMDVDTTTRKNAHEKLLSHFGSGKADVLLGTQMVAKGLDFPKVTLVGVIAADTILNLPDFRASEKTFQLLTQVAGRAGRHELPGEVVIQTYNPDHYSIVTAGGHDYMQFVELELQLRKARQYPPYSELILITLAHEQVPVLVRMSQLLANHLRKQAQKEAVSHATGANRLFMEVLGPIASPLAKIKDRYRFQCIVKYGGDPKVIAIITETLAMFEQAIEQEKLQVSVDVDPQILM